MTQARMGLDAVLLDAAGNERAVVPFDGRAGYVLSAPHRFEPLWQIDSDSYIERPTQIEFVRTDSIDGRGRPIYRQR